MWNFFFFFDKILKQTIDCLLDTNSKRKQILIKTKIYQKELGNSFLMFISDHEIELARYLCLFFCRHYFDLKYSNLISSMSFLGKQKIRGRLLKKATINTQNIYWDFMQKKKWEERFLYANFLQVILQVHYFEVILYFHIVLFLVRD